VLAQSMRAAMLGALVAAGCAAQTESHRTDWFQKVAWGVFTHYLADTVAEGEKTPPEKWNALVDGFDVAGLAEQLASVGAKYYFITLGQNSGHYLAPNATYDRLTGIRPSKCARRDLVSDLAAALEPKGIRLLVYLPAGAPDRDPAAMQALQWRLGPYPNRKFQVKWEQVITEWSRRWGRRVNGWWFDGCYWPNIMYRSATPPNFSSFAAAARAGNPDSIVAFNRGVIYPIISITEQEDYTAGEINEPERVRCSGRWVDGAQFHMLSYLGVNWGRGPVRFQPSQVVEWTRKINGKGGVVTWDVPIQPNGLIPQPFLDQLKMLRK
jgi:hypothetical protein